MKFNIDYILYIILIAIICFLGYSNYKLNKKTKVQIEEIKKMDKVNNKYTTIYYDQVIESLKNKNKILYDSIKIYKDQLEYYVEFKFKKDIKTGIIETDNIEPLKKDSTRISLNNENLTRDSISIYEYKNDNVNDSLNYTLKIGSYTRPKWYSLDLSVSDKFKLMNRKIGDANVLDITSNGTTMLDDVVVFNRKKRNNFIDNICIGPSVNFGYNFISKDVELTFGFSITYDIKDLFIK